MGPRDSMYEFYTFFFLCMFDNNFFKEEQLRILHRFFLKLSLCNIDLVVVVHRLFRPLSLLRHHYKPRLLLRRRHDYSDFLASVFCRRIWTCG